MKFCPGCQTEYGDDVSSCARDGERLVKLGERRDSLVGQILDGRYRIEALIGEGGMGAVYRGVQDPIGRIVAIKVLSAELARDKTAVRRFFNEARVVSRLRHPHTITLYDFGQSDGGHLYIAMEFLRGTSLHRLIRGGQLTLPDIVEVADQIAQSLEEAHELGIIHRDLKPENVLVDRMGSRNIVKVLDFGIAKVPDAAEHLTRTGMVFGTPNYMSPEQAQGFDLDGRSDLYTLGILLYEMLAGEAPFDADSPMQVALKQVTVTPRPISDLSRHRPLPRELATLVMDLLEKEPSRRPADAAEVRRRLCSLARDLPGIRVEVAANGTETLRVMPAPETLPEPWKNASAAGDEAGKPTTLNYEKSAEKALPRAEPPSLAKQLEAALALSNIALESGGEAPAQKFAPPSTDPSGELLVSAGPRSGEVTPFPRLSAEADAVVSPTIWAKAVRIGPRPHATVLAATGLMVVTSIVVALALALSDDDAARAEAEAYAQEALPEPVPVTPVVPVAERPVATHRVDWYPSQVAARAAIDIARRAGEHSSTSAVPAVARATDAEDGRSRRPRERASRRTASAQVNAVEPVEPTAVDAAVPVARDATPPEPPTRGLMAPITIPASTQ